MKRFHVCQVDFTGQVIETIATTSRTKAAAERIRHRCTQIKSREHQIIIVIEYNFNNHYFLPPEDYEEDNILADTGVETFNEFTSIQIERR